MTKKATAATPAPGHNSGLDPAQERAFIREFQNIKDAESEMASSKGELAQIYKRLENAGFSKDHVAFAKSLEKKNVSEVLADFEMKIKICRIVGHAVGRQLDFLDKDRTPIEDKAYADGVAAGKFGRSATNPYGMETMSGQRWQQGFGDGNKFRNEALNEAVNGNDNLIKGAGDADDQTEDKNQDQAEVGSDTTDDAGVVSAEEKADAPLEGEVIEPSADAGAADDDWDAAAPKTAA